MSTQHHGIAVIMDLVGSRRQPDRAVTQRQLESALGDVNAIVPAIQPLEPTIGDEAQGSYPDLGTAIRAALLLRLALPEPLDCRFGFGGGAWEVMGRSGHGPMQDGSAWWSAREAVSNAESLALRRHKSLRSWYCVAEDEIDRHPPAGLVNALLLCRDEIVTAMGARSRRLALGLLRGRTQAELAESEGVSQSAVSQNLRRSGAHALIGSVETFG